jgi:hypothetical protein
MNGIIINEDSTCRGWYICTDADGDTYLGSDGEIHLTVCHDNVSFFWPTEEAAQEFYDGWDGK